MATTVLIGCGKADPVADDLFSLCLQAVQKGDASLITSANAKIADADKEMHNLLQP